ncbi:unnamed protein product, partial [marine sediment metagenome]
ELIWHKTESLQSDFVIRWDIKDKNNREISSGGYFAVVEDLSTGEKTRRLISIIK